MVGLAGEDEPDLSLSRLKLAFPFKSSGVRDGILDALKKAGLPET
jgi:hypothetical protein